MKWTAAKNGDGNVIRDYLLPREYACVSFTARLNRDGIPRIPPRKKTQVMIHADPGKRRITGAILQTRYGFIFPVLDSAPTEELADAMKRYSSLFFSVMGTEEDVTALDNVLGRNAKRNIRYHIMTQESERPVPLIPPDDLTIRRAFPGDCDALYPLQEQYEREEVLLNPASYNEEITRKCLLKDLEKQIVFLAQYQGKTVAKAATNARGFSFDQIGGVFTLPEFRNKGFAGYLMKDLLRYINQSGKRGTLFVKKDNGPAVSLYRKLGFSIRESFSIIYY
ncbi:MAG: GNAT family N-acetyltransferase [Spirochaetia bacterium]